MSESSAARLGGVSNERRLSAREINTNITALEVADGPLADRERADYFQQRDGVIFAGSHLLLELWGAQRLSDVEFVEAALRAGATAAGATILHSFVHPFGPNMGVSGVVVLAESHISIHTWPERDYAAIDIFMCGACNPRDAIGPLETAFAPNEIEVVEQKRGVLG